MKIPLKRNKSIDPAATEEQDASVDLAKEDAAEASREKKHFKFKVSVQTMFSNGKEKEKKKKKKRSKPVEEDVTDHVLTAVSTDLEPAEDSTTPIAQDLSAVEEEAPGKKVKKKKEKKPKVKKEKQEKDQPEGKRRPIIVYAFAGGCVLATGMIVTILLLTGSSRGSTITVEDQLAAAASYTSDEKYDEAEEIYNEILTDDQTIIDAHLGLAENYLAQGIPQMAIEILRIGFEATGDAEIGARLEELRVEEPQEPGTEPIVWQDSALEAMVRMAMGVSASQPISEADLSSIRTLKIVGGTHATVNPAADDTIRNLNSVNGYTIDDQLYTERGNIRSLDDLAHFKGLRKLVIGYNQITDIGGLSQLTELETLALYFNEISDLSALSSLSSLRYLYIYHNNISNLQPLSQLGSLRTLYLQSNQVTDVSPLQGTKGLVELSIAGNQVTSIEALSGLDHLVFLYADNNQIEDIRAVEQLSQLTDVSFLGNPVRDYSPSSHVRNVNKKY